MRVYKNHFLGLIGFTCLLTTVVLFFDFVYFNRDDIAHGMIDELERKSPDILFFGDSVIHTSGECDKGSAGIDELLEGLTGRSILPIVHKGYSPALYENYIRLLTLAQNKPRLIIISVNLSSFSDAWFFNFKMKSLYLRYLASGRIDFPEYIRYRFLKAEEEDGKRRIKREVRQGGLYLGRVGEIINRMQVKTDVPLECVQWDYRNIYGQQLALQFRLYYMNRIIGNQPMLRSLVEAVRLAKKSNANVIVYLTPINIEDGERFVGNGFRKRVSENIEILRNTLEKEGISLLDMTSKVGEKHFLDKAYSSEHLDMEGRRLVARVLAKEVRYRFSPE